MSDAVNEKQQLMMRLKHIAGFFEKETSDLTKLYILGTTNVAMAVKKIPEYVAYMNNILSLSFIFAHGCFRLDCDSEEPESPKAKKHSSLRIINSLKKAYTQYPVTEELIQFVLSDIQFDMLQGDSSELYGIFENLCNFHSKEFTLTKYYKVIAKWKSGPSRFSMNLNELAGMLCELLEEISFLKNYDLLCEEDGNYVFKDKRPKLYNRENKYEEIPIRHILFEKDDKKGFYTLFSAEKEDKGRNKKLNLRYLAVNGNALSYTVTLDKNTEAENVILASPEEYYAELTGLEWDQDPDETDAKKNGNFIDQVHAINYKYIKNLALAISDAISVNRGSKEALYTAFHVRHKDVFDKVSLNEINDHAIDWDGIVVMLLIESSTTSVLETLIRNVPQTFFDIVKNLCKRIDNPDMPIYGRSDDELEEMVNKIIRTKLILGEAAGFGKIPRVSSNKRLFPRAAAVLIISSLSAILEEEKEDRAICAGNIYDNISLLTKMQSDPATEQHCKYVSIILGETFRHLLCFYKGLFAYGEIKAGFDAESYHSCFTAAQIAVYQKQLKEAFMNAAKKEAESLKEINPSESDGMIDLMQRFLALCENCSVSDESRLLYTVLGKHEILNFGEFRGYVRDYTRGLRTITVKNVDSWISFALSILTYLRSGSFAPVKNGEAMFRAIYPFTATYNRGNENYDGYKTVTFSLNIDVDGEERMDSRDFINVLTEFSYNLSDVFYCLPNVLRSNKKWWIDPVLISFKEFNDIFAES